MTILIIIIIGFIIGYITTKGTKSQNIRLLDVFILGPIMIYLGWINYKKLNDNQNILKLLHIMLIFFGSTTITYNLRNYIEQSN